MTVASPPTDTFTAAGAGRSTAATVPEPREDAARGSGRTLVMINSGSGRKRAREEKARLEERIRQMPGCDVLRLTPKTDIEQEVRQAVAQGYSLVVAAGGDGTISAVSGVLAGTGTRLGVLPLGTFNFFARSLGIPEDPEEALEVLQSGQERQVALGSINDRIFINNASLGAYAAVLEARESIYARWGRSRLVAYWSVLVAMLTLYRPLRMRVTVDGQRHRVRSPMAFIAIRPYQLEEYGLEGTDAIEEGRLALYLAPDSGRLMLLWRALKVLMRTVEAGEDYRLMTGEEMVIETGRARELVARDGERNTMRRPYTVRILPAAVTVMVPAGSSGAR